MADQHPDKEISRAIWLFRRWKAGAGPLGRYVPAAPFTALETYGLPQVPLRQRQNPVGLDRVCQALADRLEPTEQTRTVQAGEAAFVVDLPGPISLGLGCYLQSRGIAPVLQFNGLYRPGSLLEGGDSLPALVHYGNRLKVWQNQPGLAFLLERERTGPPDLPDLNLWQTFDNRYHAGEHIFPALTLLKAGGLQALIDLRVVGDELPLDLNEFYQGAAQAGLSVYQAGLPLDWFQLSSAEGEV